MRIGIDLTSLQGAHRMRGIGYTLLNIINSLSEDYKPQIQFVFYVYETSEHRPDPIPLLNLIGVSYEVRNIKPSKGFSKRLPGKLGIFTGIANQLLEIRDLHLGDSRISDFDDIDYFLQTDQSRNLPKRHRGTNMGLILYDIIPYVLEWDYLWSYKVARIKGYSRKGAARRHAHRMLYGYKLKVNTRRANQLFAISECTKKDFVKYLGVNGKKITVTPLGINMPQHNIQQEQITYYENGSWGYLPKRIETSLIKPFVLYVGGADERRKLNELVSAFNILRARGMDINLVLSGDSMQGPDNIATDSIRKSLKASSYLEDIYFVGFTDDKTRDWLYANCLCFVFPSRYEGFGLPVLEAMAHGTPVICYDNSATREVAGWLPIYTNDARSLATEIVRMHSITKQELNKIKSRNIAHARKSKWQETSSDILKKILKYEPL